MINGQVQTRPGSIGFTIVEVVVAFTLFSITTIMLVAVAQAVQYSHRQSIYTNIAKQAVQSKIAEYQNLGYEAYAVGHTEDFSDSTTLDDLPAGKVATIEVSQSILASSSKVLRATIVYPTGDSSKSIKMKAYLTKAGLSAEPAPAPAPVPTSLNCFLLDNGGTRVRNYYDYEHNNSSNPPCPRDVVIPPQITSIYTMSMGSKNLTSVVFLDAGQSIAIGNNAFQYNSLGSLIIPSAVSSVGSGAFMNGGITSLTFLDRSTPLNIGSSAFMTNSLGSLTIPAAVGDIGSSAFVNGGITSLTFLDRSTNLTIGATAFQNNSISSLVTPPQVTRISTNAFTSNPLAHAQVASSTTISYGAFPSATTVVRY